MAPPTDPVKAMVRRHFFETGQMLLDWWIATFPQAASPAVESKIKLTGVVLGSAEREEEAIRAWHDGMSRPLSDKSIKYASALRRILGRDGAAYHACEYRDLSALILTADVDIVRDLDLASSLEGRPDDKSQFWTFLVQMNRFALQYLDVSFSLPSRSDIAENIRLHKVTKAPSKPAMLRGFDSTLDDLVEKVGVRWKEPYPDKAGEWAAALGRKDVDFKAACADRDLPLLRRAFPSGMVRDVFSAEDGAYDSEAWASVDQLCNFVGVHSSIPNKMMGRIETTAHKLAGEIALGKADLGSLNLSEIGQSVLEGCDPEDMEQFTKNMGSLLPVLKDLQENVAQTMQSGGA